MSKQARLLSFFRGKWAYTRDITSSITGTPMGSGNGIASFVTFHKLKEKTPEKGSEYLLYRERGPFMMPGATGPIDATKQQMWEFHSGRQENCVDDISVYFTLPPLKGASVDPDSPEIDGYEIERPFHPLTFDLPLSFSTPPDSETAISNAREAVTNTGIMSETRKVEPQVVCTSHWCDPDDYRGTFELVSDSVFTSKWDVKGPRKAYVISTRYTRLVE